MTAHLFLNDVARYNENDVCFSRRLNVRTFISDTILLSERLFPF